MEYERGFLTLDEASDTGFVLTCPYLYGHDAVILTVKPAAMAEPR